MNFLRYFFSRTLTYICVLLLGITIVFFIPRMLPSDPVNAYLATLVGRSATIDPVAYDKMRIVLAQTFGLEGSVFSQYLSFLKRVLITQNFGPSLSMYPATVSSLIMRAFPWTIGLLLFNTLTSWLIGNAIGLIVGFRKEKSYAKILEAISVLLYPIPFYIFALALIIVFAYVVPIFPISFAIFTPPSFTWTFFREVIRNSILPALSMVVVNTGWWIIGMKALSSNIAEEDYVTFARLKGLSERRIMVRYILPNVALPQVTMLALQIGLVFGGALICEMLFNYPGLGMLIFNAIQASDYNLIISTISLSIVGVATMTFVIDLISPLIDPRIRYR